MSKVRAPWEGAYRAAGEGPLGIHQGSPVYTPEAAEHRRVTLGGTVPKTWIETFSEGQWKRIGKVILEVEPCLRSPS